MKQTADDFPDVDEETLRYGLMRFLGASSAPAAPTLQAVKVEAPPGAGASTAALSWQQTTAPMSQDWSPGASSAPGGQMKEEADEAAVKDEPISPQKSNRNETFVYPTAKTMAKSPGGQARPPTWAFQDPSRSAPAMRSERSRSRSRGQSSGSTVWEGADSTSGRSPNQKAVRWARKEHTFSAKLRHIQDAFHGSQGYQAFLKCQSERHLRRAPETLATQLVVCPELERVLPGERTRWSRELQKFIWGVYYWVFRFRNSLRRTLDVDQLVRPAVSSESSASAVQVMTEEEYRQKTYVREERLQVIFASALYQAVQEDAAYVPHLPEAPVTDARRLSMNRFETEVCRSCLTGSTPWWAGHM